MPRYLLLLHDSATMPEGIGPDEIQAIIQRYIACPPCSPIFNARVGDHAQAAVWLDTALGHEMSEPERRLLEERAAAGGI